MVFSYQIFVKKDIFKLFLPNLKIFSSERCLSLLKWNLVLGNLHFKIYSNHWKIFMSPFRRWSFEKKNIYRKVLIWKKLFWGKHFFRKMIFTTFFEDSDNIWLRLSSFPTPSKKINSKYCSMTNSLRSKH